MKNILVFAYYSIKDPVFVSATLSYLLEAKKESGIHFYLVTFEHSGFSLSNEEIEEMEQSLKEKDIFWYRSRWRTGGVFKPILKIVDLLQGIVKGLKIVKSQNCKGIYSEGVVGASIAYFISKISRVPHIIHSFEPHAETMKESGVWSSGSWEYYLLRSFERRIAKQASVLITGTQAYKEKIEGWGVKNKIYVIPSCIDTEHFQFSKNARKELRAKHEVHDLTTVIVYLGKFGGMYMEEELFQFFRNCEKSESSNFNYWVFSGDDQQWIEKQLETHGIPKEKTLVKKLDKNEVPQHLSAADVGVVAVRPFPSKRYCSPIKTGEYWACGLPAIIPNGVGDDYQIVKDNPSLGIGVEKLELFKLEVQLDRIEHEEMRKKRALGRYSEEWLQIFTSI